MQNEIIINSLSEYIDFISKNTSNDYYFRGESGQFYDRISSGLRNSDKFDFNKKNKHRIPFLNYIKEFYMEISNRLSNIDRDNFISFAQHHGIPTNLLDVSRDPLVALYFACQETNDSNEGYVYLFRKDNVLDITQYLPKYGMYNTSEFILELCNLEKRNLINTICLFQNFFKNREVLFKELFLILIDERQHIKINFNSNIFEEKVLQTFNRCCKNDKIDIYSLKEQDCFCDILKIINELKDRLDIKYNIDEIINGNISYFVTIYTLLMIEYFKHIIEVGEPVFWINFLPIFKYETVSCFERIKHQKGLFFYQCYLEYIEPVYELRGCPIQRIESNQAIKINNKENILKSLDKIGINRKTIFDDFDNIAKYIVERND